MLRFEDPYALSLSRALLRWSDTELSYLRHGSRPFRQWSGFLPGERQVFRQAIP
jgi:hypothetical protein